jgi:Shikimate dehydrogenase substrate binding domain
VAPDILQDRLRKRGLERDPVKLAQWDEYWAEHGDQLCSWTDVPVTELGAPRKRANPMISGTTTLIAHLGYPTHTFKSSLICNPWFETHAIDAVVVPMGIKPEDYPDFFRSVFTLTNIRGALVTMPHKVVTMNLVDEVSPTAQIAGATNAVLRRDDGSLLAEQFDGAGFVRGALRKGFDPHGKRALVVGNGRSPPHWPASDLPASACSTPIQAPPTRSPSASARTTLTCRSPWGPKIPRATT